MEKLDKVIAGLEHCRDKDRGCDGCPYYDDADCENRVVRDAVCLLSEYRGMKIAVTAVEVLERYRTAFEALAKGEE